ncbi:MAG TPA: LacI family transcriptional regulator [Bacteroidetes bacterium]|nr:LacI family transcriptional regulator [Bacteroidota bacterium]
MRRKVHITLDDIAQQLSVSRVTVSKALRGHPDISSEMTKKVRAIADELGYSPNIFARNLSARRSQMMGLVVPKIAHYFFGSVIESVYNVAFENNYEIILMVSQENPERERKHIETLMSMRVDGIMVSISEHTRNFDVFRRVRSRGIPLVFVDRAPVPMPQGFSSVVVDDRGGAFQATEQAIRIGHKKLAHLAGPQDVSIGREREEGFKEALRAHGLPIRDEWIIEAGFGKEDGYRGFKRFYDSKNLPDFIFAVTYPVALGVYEAARDFGVRIPQDVDIMCFGDSDMHRFISPSLSCVNQPTAELGRKAFQLLLETIRHSDDFPAQHVRIKTDLIIRETCRGKI